MNITKTILINKIVKNITCFEEFKDKICEAIDDSPYLTKDAKRIAKTIVIHKITRTDKRTMVREFYDELENAVFDSLSNKDNYQDENAELVLRLFEGICIRAKLLPAHEEKFNFSGQTVFCNSKIQIKPKITETYKNKVNTAKR